MQKYKYTHKFFVISVLTVVIVLLSMTGCNHKSPQENNLSSVPVITSVQENPSSDEPSVTADAEISKGALVKAWREPPIAKSLDGEIEFPHCETMSISNGWHDYSDGDGKIRDLAEKRGAECLLSPKFVDDLIARGLDVNQYNEYGQTPIMMVRDVDSIKKLLAAGANLHHMDDYEKTALDYANSPEIVDVLMQSGQLSVQDLKSERMDETLTAVRFYYGAFDDNEDYDSEYKRLILKYNIIRTMDLRAAKRLLKKNWLLEKDLTETKKLRAEFLHYAILNKLDNSFVLSLFEQDFSCDYSCKSGQNCKNETCAKDIADVGNAELMKYIIAHKLVTDKAVFTELLTADRTQEIADLLIQAGADIDSAYAATKDESVGQRLKSKGAKIPPRIKLSDIHNATAMKDALVQVTDVKEQLQDGSVLFSPDISLSLFKILVSAGANIHAVEKDGESLLHHYNHYYNAKEAEDYVERIKILLKAGLSPNTVDKSQSTALFGASPRIAELLIDAGVDVNAVNSRGHSVVKYIAGEHGGDLRRDSVELLEMLVKAKASDLQKGSDFLKRYGYEDASKFIDYADYVSDTYSSDEYYDYNRKVHTRNDSTLRKQLQNGEDPNKKDENGRTPLFYVECAKYARLLIAAGADVNVIDNEGNTPLLWILYRDSNEPKEAVEDSEADEAPEYDWYKCDEVCTNNIVHALIAAGADTSIVNKKGQSAKDYLESHKIIADSSP